MTGRVSDLPVRGVSQSVRGQRPPRLADLEVYPTFEFKCGRMIDIKYRGIQQHVGGLN